MAALIRYGNSLPINRIDGLQKVVPFSASTQWELLRDAARKMKAGCLELIRQAAPGAILNSNNTSMKILDFLVEKRESKERGEKPPERTGTDRVGVAGRPADHPVLHGPETCGGEPRMRAGQRMSGLARPIQMCGGLEPYIPLLREAFSRYYLPAHLRRA